MRTGVEEFKGREETGKCGMEGQVEVAGWKGGSVGRGSVAWDVIWREIDLVMVKGTGPERHGRCTRLRD